MGIGDKMSYLNYYSNAIINNRLQKLSEAIIHKQLNPYSVLLKAATKTGDVSATFNAINEAVDNTDWWDKEAERIRASRDKSWDDYIKTHEKEEPTKDVPTLTAMLKNVVNELINKHGFNGNKINSLLSQAIKDAEAVPGAGTYTAKQEYPANYKNTANAGGQIDADLAKQLGIGNWDYGDDESGEPQVNHPKTDRSQAEEPVLPSWFNQMTSAEKAWYNKLSPNQKRQFITAHDQKISNSNGVASAGDKYIDPNSQDFKQVKDIAYYKKNRNPWMTDDPSTLKASAGLWNRHLIRQQLQKNLGDWGDQPLPDFDDLLQKDNHKVVGNMLKEWCNMAGIKSKKGK
jgi:hypothetical protein